MRGYLLEDILDNLSDNMLMGAVNAFNDEVGVGKNTLNNQLEPFSKIARQYKAKQMRWVIFADEELWRRK